jgi:predicted permease
MAIRASVGAGRGRLIRQLLTESVVLSLLGGALGVGLGMAAVRLLLASDPGNLPRMDGVTLDWRVLAFTFAVALLAGLLIGLLPAIQTSLVDLNSTLRGGDVFRQSRFRSVLVTGEIALAAALLFEAGLLIRAFVTMRTVDPGFDVGSVVAVNTSLADSNIRDASELGTLLSSGTERIRMLPGVLAAGAAWCVPLDPSCAAGVPFKIDGKDQTGRWSSVSPDYFAVLRIPVLLGRPFTLHDNAYSPPVMIINDALARQFLRGRDPLSLRLILGSGARTEPPRQIVGVVRDTRDMDLRTNPRPTVYIPLSQLSDAAISTRRDLVPLAWIVRTEGDPVGLRSAIQKTILKASGRLTITSLRTMRQVATESTAAEAFSMLLLAIFGCTALGLAAIGVYGLTAYSVRNRTQEFGVRMALGCSSAQLQRSVMLEGLRLASFGVLLGSTAGIGLARSIAHLFYNLEPWDPLVFVAVPVVLGMAALLATWIPARQSSRVDPLLALRCQ